MSVLDAVLRDEVTAVVITRERAPMLRQALTSVLGQRGGPVDVVVVVDGPLDESVDDTARVLSEFPDVRVIRQPHASGPSAARNLGLAEVRTPWVAFLDDDDVWAPGKLLAQHQALAAEPRARWCHTGAMAVDGDLRPVGAMRALGSGDVRTAILTQNIVCGGGSSVYAHTATVRAVGGFATDVRRHEDWDLWIRLALESPLVAVDQPLVGFRRHTVSRTGASVEGDEVTVLRRYTAERQSLGVTRVSRHPLQAVHDNPLTRGSSRLFARSYLRAGTRHRSPRLVAAAVGLLVCPRLLAHVSRWRWRARTPATWFGDVASWLPALSRETAARIPVSVVIPAYQRADMVGRAVRSALSQVPAPTEVIVVDDGSRDGTAEAAVSAGASVIRLPHNQGEGAARNAGLDAASCDWIALLDSDDEWLPGHLARLWSARQGFVLVADSCVGDTSRSFGGNPGRRPRVVRTPADLLWPWSGIAPSCALILRANAISVGGFRSLPIGADLEFWLRLLESGRGLSLPDVGCIYHEHAGQVTAGIEGPELEIVNAIVDGTVTRPWHTQRLQQRRAAVARWDLARGQLRTGRPVSAVCTLVGLGRRPADVAAAGIVIGFRIGMRVRGRLEARRVLTRDRHGGSC